MDTALAKKIVKYSLYTVLAILFISLVWRPAYLGYTVYKTVQDAETTELDVAKAELEKAQITIQSCQQLNERLLNDIEDYSNLQTKCRQNIFSAETQVTTVEEETEQRVTELKRLLYERRKKLETLNAVTQNAAHTICCKSGFTHYSIVDDEINCGFEGDEQLSC